MPLPKVVAAKAANATSAACLIDASLVEIAARPACEPTQPK
jgi:hypothetical protein